jgi:hypothetical protein
MDSQVPGSARHEDRAVEHALERIHIALAHWWPMLTAGRANVVAQGGSAANQYELPVVGYNPLPLVAKHREELHDLSS